MECAKDRKGPSREFYTLFFEDLVATGLMEEPMHGAKGVLPPAAPAAPAAPAPAPQRRERRPPGLMHSAKGFDVLPPAAAPAEPAPAPLRRPCKRVIVIDSDEDEDGGRGGVEDEDGGQSESDGHGCDRPSAKRARLHDREFEDVYEDAGPAAGVDGRGDRGEGGSTRRSGRLRAHAQLAAAAVDAEALAKYRFVGSVIGRALLERLLDLGGTEAVPAAFVPLIPLLAGKEPGACTTAEEALALWEPFLHPQVHGSMSRILSEPVSPEAPVPMDPFLQGCPDFDGEEARPPRSNKVSK
eukprot:tig00000057_g21.t1